MQCLNNMRKKKLLRHSQKRSRKKKCVWKAQHESFPTYFLFHILISPTHMFSKNLFHSSVTTTVKFEFEFSFLPSSPIRKIENCVFYPFFYVRQWINFISGKSLNNQKIHIELSILYWNDDTSNNDDQIN